MSVSKLFTQEQLAALDPARIPRHIAIMPDGNRRWAQQQSDLPVKGYRAGADVIVEIVKASKEIGVKVLTFYLFSTENWSRPQEEIDVLMCLFEEFLTSQCEIMVSENIRLKTIGDLSRLPGGLIAIIEHVRHATEHCSGVEMVMALNYGARDEICRAVQRIVDDRGHSGKITESLLSRYLDTASLGDPDLLIRTSGEMRISNFLLWQLSYAELYVTNVLWPDFTPWKFLEAVTDFQKRKRRLGGT